MMVKRKGTKESKLSGGKEDEWGGLKKKGESEYMEKGFKGRKGKCGRRGK